MLSIVEMSAISRARLMDAEVLLSNQRFDGAAYLCGYAVEIALKSRIVRTHGLTGFPATKSEFRGHSQFKSHDLEQLLKLSGWEARIKEVHLAAWSSVKVWTPEARYRPDESVLEAEASLMIQSATRLVGALL
jgi:HEPN domain-containing protein